jgi:hypothetical protein
MTNQGAMREDRLVFPIPPGTHWTEVQAVATNRNEGGRLKDQGKTNKLPAPRSAACGSSLSPHPSSLPMSTISAGGLFFAAPKLPKEKPKRSRPPKEKIKVDPALVAKARALRDVCMERQDQWLISGPRGKYDVSRALQSATRLTSSTSMRDSTGLVEVDPQSAIAQLPAA